MAGGRAAPAGVPDPELVEQAKRRSFTAKYKLEILGKADACTAPGEIGELLRAEGLYTSHLTYWRKQRKDGASKEDSAGRGGASRATVAITRSPGCSGGWSTPSRNREGKESYRDSGKSLEHSWSRCSVPRPRTGAPSDDRRDR